MSRRSPLLLLALSLLASAASIRAEFVDSFEGPQIEDWMYFTGDGSATMQFIPHDGFARIAVDGTKDAHNVWWAIIKRDVSAYLDLEQLQDPAYELRVEARVRPSHAPRRVNFMINTQRTTDFHEHLREYDLPDTSGWHTISMTTRGFDAVPGDNVFVQLGVTDWGPGNYYVDIDYYRAAVVRRDQAGADLGEPLVYHPPEADPATFSHHLEVAHDSVINSSFPDVNFDDWSVEGPGGTARVLTIASDQWAVLRWDLTRFDGLKADGAGLLELTTHSVPRGGDYVQPFGEDLGIEFGKVRVIEILAGEPAWDQQTVTYHRLLQGSSVADVFNSQMIFDLELSGAPGSRSLVTLPRPVMQRLLDGRTKGLLIRPLGALTPSIYASEDATHPGPILHFSTSR